MLFAAMGFAGCAAPSKKKVAPPPPTPTATATPTVTPRWFPFPKDSAIEPGPAPVTILCVGDLMFGRRVGDAMAAGKKESPFRDVLDLLRSGDMATGNLECALGDPAAIAQWEGHKKILLVGPLEAARWTREAGFQLLSVGNNHALDYREDGFASTLGALREAGLGWVGTWENDDQVQEPWVFEARGTRVAFLAYSDVSPGAFRTKGKGHPGTIPPMLKGIARDIAAAKRKAEVVVVHAHWGVEYQSEPTERQKALARRMIDSGADAVIGHHPHVLQRMERYKGRFIIYSLGNFLFDLRRPATHPSLILRLRLEKGRPPVADFHPTWSGDMFPRPLREGEWDAFPRWVRSPRRVVE